MSERGEDEDARASSVKPRSAVRVRDRGLGSVARSSEETRTARGPCRPARLQAIAGGGRLGESRAEAGAEAGS